MVVLDTGIWISAIGFGGVPALALKKATTTDRIAISKILKEEIVRTLTKKLAYSQDEIERALAVFLTESVLIEITGEVCGVCRDLNDDHVLECAKKAGASFIVSGDKDLLALEVFEGIRIITARQYVEGV